jgi:hypothetical protein
VNRTTLPLALAALALLGAAGFAIERGLTASSLRSAREAAAFELEGALALAAKHPSAFGGPALQPGESALKNLAQQIAVRRSLTIGYLSESEREAEKDRVERQVILRLVGPGHAGLVALLQDLERQGGGVRVKEVHVRPSLHQPDAYEDAEIVLARLEAAREK